MPKFLIGWLLGLGANAIALILCSLIFSGFSLSVDGFVISLIVFAVLSAFFTWVVLKFLLRNAGSIVALTGLGFATGYVGFIVIMPWLAFSAWHAYHQILRTEPWPALAEVDQ